MSSLKQKDLRAFIYVMNLFLTKESQKTQQKIILKVKTTHKAILQHIQHTLITTIVAILIISLLLFLLVYKRFLQPISNYKNLLLRVSQGYTNDRFPTSYTKELMQIITALHTLKTYVIQEKKQKKLIKKYPMLMIYLNKVCKKISVYCQY